MNGPRRLRTLPGPAALALLLIALGIGLGAVIAVVQPPIFRSTAVLFVSTESSGAVSDLDQGGGGVSPIAPRPGVLGDLTENGYAGLATTSYVLSPVIRQLGLHTTAGELAQRVHAESPADAVVTSISADDPSPSRAADIANAVATRMREVVAEVEPVGSTSSSTTTVVRAVPAGTPVLPNLSFDLAVGAAAGAVIAGAVSGSRALRRAARQEPTHPDELALVPAHGLFDDRADLS